MEQRENQAQWSAEAEEKFDRLIQEDVEIGSGPGGGSEGPGVGPKSGTGDYAGQPAGILTDTGTPGFNQIDSDPGVGDAAEQTAGLSTEGITAGRARPTTGLTGRAAKTRTNLATGTGNVGGLGGVGTSALGPEHMRDPMERGQGNPINELTPDDSTGGIGMSGAGTGTAESQNAEEWPNP